MRCTKGDSGEGRTALIVGELGYQMVILGLKRRFRA